MLYLTTIIIILLATVFMVGLGERINLPWPVMMTLLGLGTMAFPWVPHIDIDSSIILPIFLPPLLWAIGVKFSWGALRRRWKSVLLYSVLLTTASALAVAGSVMWWVPGMSVAMALAIGAAIAPPDPVAVEAVAEPVGIPRRLIATLQTEGSFNDAISLVLFHAAIHAIESGHHVDALQVSIDFVAGSALAVVIGYLFGWVGGYVRRAAYGTVARSAVSLVIPFAAYLVAEHIHASGVIAVVIAAIQFSSTKNLVALDAEDRLANASFWQVIELLLTGLAFGLIGLQASGIISSANPERLLTLFMQGAMISAVAIAVRLAWFGAVWLAGTAKGSPVHGGAPRSFAEVLIMTWSGMRGLVTLILALSIPMIEGYEHLREDAIVIAISVLAFTLVLPGLTLPTLMKVLKVEVDESEKDAVSSLLKIAQDAALVAIQEEAKDTSPEVQERVTDMCTAITRRDDLREMVPENFQPRLDALKKSKEEYARIRDAAMAAAQAEVLSAQDRYDPDDVYRVVRKLDILSQADAIRQTTNQSFVLPGLAAGAVALERYNLVRQHLNLGTSSIPVIANAPSSPFMSQVDSGEQRTS